MHLPYHKTVRHMGNPKRHKWSVRLIGMKPADVQDQARLDQDQMREEQPFRKEPDEREWLHFRVRTSGNGLPCPSFRFPVLPWCLGDSIDPQPPPCLPCVLFRLGIQLAIRWLLILLIGLVVPSHSSFDLREVGIDAIHLDLAETAAVAVSLRAVCYYVPPEHHLSQVLA